MRNCRKAKRKYPVIFLVNILCPYLYDYLQDETDKQNYEMSKLKCQTSATEKKIVLPVFVSAAESRENRAVWKGTEVSAKSFLRGARELWSAQAPHFYDLSKATSYRVRYHSH